MHSHAALLSNMFLSSGILIETYVRNDARDYVLIMLCRMFFELLFHRRSCRPLVERPASLDSRSASELFSVRVMRFALTSEQSGSIKIPDPISM
jgi:hypothetical protein